MSYQYDSTFFDFVNASAGKSASLFLGRLIERCLTGMPASVVDVGCGRGIWAAEWLKRGCPRVRGVDGDYVTRSTLVFPEAQFHATDISKPFDLKERFDYLQCIEVGEHIPGGSADTLVDNLTRHSDLILFSAATPGQGGEFHVNEQPFDYWRAKFEARGYQTFDAIRPQVLEIEDIEPWYRYNAFLYAKGPGQARLSAAARATLAQPGKKLSTVAPLSWRARCGAISMLPSGLTLSLARLKHRLANATRPQRRAG
jgi:SAM-dependent methyltransferase